MGSYSCLDRAAGLSLAPKTQSALKPKILHLKTQAHVVSGHQVMYEAELGGTVVDFLAFFLGLAISFSIHKMSNFYGSLYYKVLEVLSIGVLTHVYAVSFLFFSA